jgi:hypothetical protein
MANEKYADVLGDRLVEMGYTHCFMLAGGGCMHLSTASVPDSPASLWSMK